MAVINILITDAGLAEVINAEQNGTAPVVLTEVGLGTGQYTPSADQTALRSEFKRLSTIAGGSIGDNAIHLTASDESDDAYTVYEFGIYTASGTLFAVFSQPVAILQKAAAAHALLAMDIVVTNIDPDSVAVGNTNFQLNSATTTKQGIVELATAAEVVAGTDGFRAVTPSALTARTATTGRTGLVELATTAETQAGKDTERAVTPAGLKTELDVRESRVVHTVNSVGPDSAGNVSIVNITGNAGTATKLATPVTINGVNFDGSESITVEDASKLPKDGTAAAATKLAAAHTINGVSFDGTADITIADSTKAPKSHASSATTYGVSSASNYGHAKASGTTPKANGTAAVGSETSSFARGDHVHPLQTSVTGSSGSCTGNAETATKLATARKINGVNFDGTTDITVEDDTKLPLSGGTMTGEIRTNRNSLITMQNTNVSISDTSRTSAYYDRPFSVNDKDDKRGAAFEVTWSANGNRSANISMRDRKDSKYITAGLVEAANGRYYFQCGGSEALLPVGAVFPFASNTAPEGCLLCNGAAVSRTTYAALFAAIGTTYGAGNGSTTFNLPNLTDRFIQGSGTAGTVKNAGLPNINGHAEDLRSGGWIAGQNYNSGCVKQTFTSTSYAASFSNYLGCLYGFNIDASKSNSIYGASATVQPPALTMRFYIKY